MSRGFVSTLFGLAMTIWSWYAHSEWPAWPALTTMRLLLGARATYADLPPGPRAAMLVLLIVINVGVWAGAAWLVLRTIQWWTTRRRPLAGP